MSASCLRLGQSAARRGGSRGGRRRSARHWLCGQTRELGCSGSEPLLRRLTFQKRFDLDACHVRRTHSSLCCQRALHALTVPANLLPSSGRSMLHLSGPILLCSRESLQVFLFSFSPPAKSSPLLPAGCTLCPPSASDTQTAGDSLQISPLRKLSRSHPHIWVGSRQWAISLQDGRLKGEKLPQEVGSGEIQSDRQGAL